MAPISFRWKTCLQEGLFTLGNSKYEYLNFIYNFMNKCLDMNRIHFNEGDVDDAFWSIVGDLNDNIH